eukprot:9592527-Alexandrium_andersonii.AAC.1
MPGRANGPKAHEFPQALGSLKPPPMSDLGRLEKRLRGIHQTEQGADPRVLNFTARELLQRNERLRRSASRARRRRRAARAGEARRARPRTGGRRG